MSQADRLSDAIPVEDIRQPELAAATAEFDKQWLHSLLRPLLLTLMLGCVVTAGTYVFVVLIPEFTASVANAIILCSALATLTACIVGALTWNTGRDIRERFKYRIAEPVGWALLLRLGLWFIMDSLPPLGLLLSQPITAIFDGTFIAGGLIVLVTWLLAEYMNRSLLVLTLQEDEVSHIARAYGRLSDTVENTLRSDRRALLDRFIAVWIGIGIIVIVLAAGSQVRPAEGAGLLTIHAQNIHPRAIVSTILYFFAGFLLIGQARLVALRARWALDGIAVDESRFRHWMLYVVGFVALVALITSLVPVGDTILLFRIITFIAQIAVAAMAYLLGALAWLMNQFVKEGNNGAEAPALKPFEMPEAFQAEEEIAPPGNDFNYATPLFWSFVAVAALIGGYHLLATRGFDWTWLRERLALLLSLLRRTADTGWRIVADVVNRITGADTMARSFTERQGRRNMDLDEQVQFTYLSILDRADAQGVGRRAAETPRRYAPRLAEALDEAQARTEAEETEAPAEPEPAAEVPDVEGVTEAFYRARYSPRAADEQDLARARTLLDRVRRLWRPADDPDRN